MHISSPFNELLGNIVLTINITSNLYEKFIKKPLQHYQKFVNSHHWTFSAFFHFFHCCNRG